MDVTACGPELGIAVGRSVFKIVRCFPKKMVADGTFLITFS
jgi:hypothetical protein